MGIRVYRSLDEIGPEFGPCALTIGNFDGVHIGHREVFRRLVPMASERGWKSAAMTFHPHPAKIVSPDRAPKLLSTPDQRSRWMDKEGLDQVLILPFTPEFSCLSPEEFVRDVLAARLRARIVMIGWNFRFGRGQAGDIDKLAELGDKYGISTKVIPGVTFRNLTVSSSEIRRLISDGAVAHANRLLGRAFSLSGAVVTGLGIGSKKTVPTLNLRTEVEVLPATGVYVTRTKDLSNGAEWRSVTNVGYRPTFKGDNLTIETHVLDDLGNHTPDHIQVYFLWRLRGEFKFPNPDALKAQIGRDVRRANAYFRRVRRWTKKATCSRSEAGRG